MARHDAAAYAKMHQDIDQIGAGVMRVAPAGAACHDARVARMTSDARIGRRRFVAGSVAALAAPLTLGACGARPADLSFWAMSYQGDYAPFLMTAFTARTGLTVDVQSLPWTASHEKLLTAFAGDALPDVFMLPNGWVDEFAMIGAIRPLPSRALLDGVFPGVVPDTRTPHAVPWSVAPRVQFFRRDLLADAGWEAPARDWDGWRRMAAALKRRRPDDYVFLFLLNWPDDLLTMFSQVGGRVLRDGDTLGNFATPEGRAALTYYKSLFDDGFAPVAASTEVQDQFAAFAQGQFAIWNSGPTTLLDFRRRSAELPPDRWGTARIAGPGGPGAISTRDVSLCVSTRSRHPNEAWALLRHCTAPASERRFAGLIGSLPARQAAWSGMPFPADVIAPFAAQARAVADSPSIPEWEQIREQVGLYAERAIRGLMSVEETLVALDARADAILAKRRALVHAGKLA